MSYLAQERCWHAVSKSLEKNMSAFPTSGTRRNTDHDDGDPPDVRRKWPSSAGEDRAMLLGFAMMGFSVLMFFVLGVTVLKPFLVREKNRTALSSLCTSWTTGYGLLRSGQVPVSPGVGEPHPFRSESAPTL
ncbi:unnamed protein product [Rangifer tarandus platyrhynchus]|uniref:Calcium-activated potassium channel subunit beta n=1 Tax=Rangifer tarandus platyrhynchus TaxID=3082113 RepID=A0ABN8ZNW1_RANTA|nr:unnamed protein product [Rangifer tarandus platyrhynchus]